MVQSVAYFTGFETGDGNELSFGLSGPITVQTAVVRTGGYALKLAAGTPTQIQYFTPSNTQIIGRCYYRVATGTPSNDGAILGFNRADSLFTTVRVNASNQLEITDLASSSTAGSIVLAANTWYRIEFAFDSSTAGGVLRAYINGTLDIDITDSSGSGSSPVTLVFTNSSTSVDRYLDDVRIDLGGIAQIGAGLCIARQGIAGTPTYDAWTKNGAATAALCWSDTPYATGTNCSDGVLNDAQTMVVDKFSTDPGRAVEGTQVINTGDTINAVKVCMMAKTAIVGNIDIRRRVGGVNTDTTVALTTSDAYYQTALFTDTVANLDAYEIGVKNDLIATTETVEDMWMMVDFSGTGLAPPALAGQIIM